VPTASARLKRTLDLAFPAYDAPSKLLFGHPDARALFPRCLAAGSYLTLLMVPLMESALERARYLASKDQVADGLAEYLARHIPEEMHGPEPGRALLDDLEALGVDTIALCAEPPPTAMAAYLGTLFFGIWHRHPVAILGFLALEGLHPHGPSLELFIERTGLPREGFRQLLLHAKLDAHHAKELHRVIDSLPLEPWQEELISLCALETIALLVDSWLDIVAEGAPVAVAADP
jgi:Iron-containing redox enzyme